MQVKENAINAKTAPSFIVGFPNKKTKTILHELIAVIITRKTIPFILVSSKILQYSI